MTTRKKAFLIAWACALAFGLVFQAETAQAFHTGCDSPCEGCSGGCAFSMETDCGGCVYQCSGSSTVKRTICVI